MPQDIIAEYGIEPLFKNNRILAKIVKGMYGLPQAGQLAFDKLRKHLAKAQYFPCEHTAGLWRHLTHTDIKFVLVVDDFGCKFVDIQHAQHLLQHLRSAYTVKVDWEGKLFCGITLDWDYKKRTVELSIPGYIDRLRTRFKHNLPTKPQHSPHPWTAPKYGAKTQFSIPALPNSLTPKERKHVQEVVGAIDNTMLPTIGSIASNQTTASIENLKFRIKQVMDYAATHSNASIKYIASQMHLWAHTDASYLCKSKA